jgi:hypothetical protein
VGSSSPPDLEDGFLWVPLLLAVEPLGRPTPRWICRTPLKGSVGAVAAAGAVSGGAAATDNENNHNKILKSVNENPKIYFVKKATLVMTK